MRLDVNELIEKGKLDKDVNYDIYDIDYYFCDIGIVGSFHRY